MGQIVKGRKKGRPSKADLARRNATAETPTVPATGRSLRRSGRRRNVRYNFEIDDYIEDDDYDDEEDERRREKKLKLLLKLQGKEGGAESPPSHTQRVTHAPATSASSSDNGDGRPLKKRKIDGDDEIGGDGDEDDDENEVDDDNDQEIKGREGEPKGSDSVPGTPSEPPSGLPLPDKKTLELILDKLQKKDIYGVYAEPVDPEELPDYHDVIEHPMDFSTLRNKLTNGAYPTLEQFESDVFLVCSNAMQYNASDTIYHKQARSIQELAKKKFQKLRIDIERSEKEVRSEQKIRSNSMAKKQMKKPMSRTIQEHVGSDFSSGATLAMAGDFQNGSNAIQAGSIERPGYSEVHVEGNSSFLDNNLDKAEEMLPGRGILSRFGRRSSLNDDNRRATYNGHCQPVTCLESLLATFDGDIKQLVPVGLHAEHSYGRSLARFAAMLGPVAWKVASQRIEQALPAGFKFGRGWVGEYEPLPTPVLMFDNCTLKESAFLSKFERTVDARKDIRISKKEHSMNGTAAEGKPPLPGLAVKKSATNSTSSVLHPAKEQPIRASMEGKPSFFCSPGSTPAAVSVNHQQQNSHFRNSGESVKKVLKQVELNSPPSTNQSAGNLVADRQILNGPELSTSRSVESVVSIRNHLQSAPFQRTNNGAVTGGLPNGKMVNNILDGNRGVSSSSGSCPSQMVARGGTCFPHAKEQALGDSVHLMRMLAEKAQNQQKSSSHSPVASPRLAPSAPSLKRDESGNAAMAAARAWMSIGAGGFKPAAENTMTNKNQISADSLYDPIWDLQQQQAMRFRAEFPVSGMHVQPEKNSFPLHAFVPQPVRMGNETPFQTQPVVFPQLLTADLSRFQIQGPWGGLNPPSQAKHKQDSFPPDLNIGFQPSGSPARQSPTVLVDSQQPDLALQL